MAGNRCNEADGLEHGRRLDAPDQPGSRSRVALDHHAPIVQLQTLDPGVVRKDRGHLVEHRNDGVPTLSLIDEVTRLFEQVVALLPQLLCPGGDLAVIIRASYPSGRYIPATYDIAARIERCGYVLKGIKVWYGTGARIRPYGYPNAYVPNIVHQNIVIFRKEKAAPTKSKRRKRKA